MLKATLWAILAIGLLVGNQRPDFSGRWIEESRPLPFPGSGGFCPKDCTITQTSENLVAKSSMGSRTYDLTKPTVTVDNKPDPPIERTAKTEWKGNSLIITTSFRSITAKTSTVNTVVLELKQDRLVVSGVAPWPGQGDVKFELIYRRAK